MGAVCNKACWPREDARELDTDAFANTGCHSSESLAASRLNILSLGIAGARAGNPALVSSRYMRERKLEEDYDVSRSEVLGEGMSGKVVMATGRIDGRQYALKEFDKLDMKKDDEDIHLIALELEIYISLDHPNIARLHAVYESDSEISLVTELCYGGELFERVALSGAFSEEDAANVTGQMLRAVAYLHQHGVVHRDLKLENFLYEGNGPDAQLKLIDFGMAKVVKDPSVLMTDLWGTLGYMSPEVLDAALGRRDGYTSKCDLWSVGVIIFTLLSGYQPITGSDLEIHQRIMRAEINWADRQIERDIWDLRSPDAIDFVKSLLQKDPSLRLSAVEALEHRWLTAGCSAESGAQTNLLSSEVLRSLQAYRQSTRLRRILLQICAQELGPQEATDLRQAFTSMDKSHAGTISLEELTAAIRGSGCDAPSPSGGGMPSGGRTSAARRRRSVTSDALELFDIMDINHDQEIHYSDFLAATMTAREQLRESSLRAVFARLDTDRSGQVNAEQLQHALALSFQASDIAEVIQEALGPGGTGLTFESFKLILDGRDVVPSPRRRSAGGLAGGPSGRLSGVDASPTRGSRELRFRVPGDSVPGTGSPLSG